MSGLNQTDIATWVQGIILDGGIPFTFEGREYLREILEDDHPDQVWSKAAQTCFTTVAMLKVIRHCIELPQFRAAMYFFPTDRDVSDFSQARFGPLMGENADLASQTEDVATKKTDRTTLKRIGNAHVYFRGMKDAARKKTDTGIESSQQQGSAKLLSVPADELVFDEMDRMDPKNVALAMKRLGASRYKLKVRLSNPSIPGYGIDKAFQGSDRRRWLIQCASCRTRNCPELDFPEKPGEDIRIIQQDEDSEYFLACRKCHKPLDPSTGEWVPESPGLSKDCHGYAVSQLISPTCDLKDVVKEYRAARFLEVLYRMTVGRAWVASESKLRAEQVLERCGDHAMLQGSSTRCTMGVDVGKDLHVVISRWHPERPGVRQYVHIGIEYDTLADEGKKRFEELDPLMRAFNVRRCVIDGGPYQHHARSFASRFPKKVYLSYFNDNQRGELSWTEDGLVQVNRTEILDASHHLVSDEPARITLPHRQPMVETFADQLAADAKQEELMPSGKVRHVYIKSGEANHFDFAFTYDYMAWMDEPKPVASRILGANRGGRLRGIRGGRR